VTASPQASPTKPAAATSSSSKPAATDFLVDLLAMKAAMDDG
jgi:hypothetical protein